MLASSSSISKTRLLDLCFPHRTAQLVAADEITLTENPKVKVRYIEGLILRIDVVASHESQRWLGCAVHVVLAHLDVARAAG